MFNCWVTFDEMPSPSAEANTTDWHWSKVTAQLTYCSFKHETSVIASGILGGWRGKKEAWAVGFCSLTPAFIHLSSPPSSPTHSQHQEALTDLMSSQIRAQAGQRVCFFNFLLLSFLLKSCQRRTYRTPSRWRKHVLFYFKMSEITSLMLNSSVFNLFKHLFWCCSGLTDSFRLLTFLTNQNKQEVIFFLSEKTRVEPFLFLEPLLWPCKTTVPVSRAHLSVGPESFSVMDLWNRWKSCQSCCYSRVQKKLIPAPTRKDGCHVLMDRQKSQRMFNTFLLLRVLRSISCSTRKLQNPTLDSTARVRQLEEL